MGNLFPETGPAEYAGLGTAVQNHLPGEPVTAAYSTSFFSTYTNSTVADVVSTPSCPA